MSFDIIQRSENKYAPVFECKLVRKGKGIAYRNCNEVPQFANVLEDVFSEFDRECLYVGLLNSQMQLLGMSMISMGGIDRSSLDISNVFKVAILANASAIILAHNHPSGDPTPSVDDILITRKVQEAGKVMGITLVDHFVCAYGPEFRYRSMFSGGLML